MTRSFGDWICVILDKYFGWFIEGAALTLLISVLGTVLGVTIGIGISVVMSSYTEEVQPKIYTAMFKVVRILLKTYVKIFRGTPMLIQAIVLYYGLMEVWHIDLNNMAVGVLVIALNTSAYMTETARAGIESVQKGQGLAADALGLKNRDKMFKIFIPQAINNMLPNIGNELVANIKDTSILNVISVSELFYVTKSVKGMIFRTYEPFLIASCIYLFLTTLVNRLMKTTEKIFYRNLLRKKKYQLSQMDFSGELADYNLNENGNAKPVLEIKHLYKSYESKEVLKNINLLINYGKVYSIIGQSGTGKSTLLKCIAQLEKVNSGEIVYMGKKIEGITDICGANIGIVFQDYCLFKNLTVLENCMLGPMRVKGMSYEKAKMVAEYYLTKLNMLEYRGHKPEILSGGQAQRVAIARALSMQPQLLLFDEPTAALDPELRCDITKVIIDLTALNVAVIIVTHDIEFAKHISDIVVHISNGEIEEYGETAELFTNPSSSVTKAFLQKVDLERKGTNG